MQKFEEFDRHNTGVISAHVRTIYCFTAYFQIFANDILFTLSTIIHTSWFSSLSCWSSLPNAFYINFVHS